MAPFLEPARLRASALSGERSCSPRRPSRQSNQKCQIKSKLLQHIPVWDKSERNDGTLARANFTYDAERDRYICPQGKPLTSTGRVHDGRTLYYRSSKLDCDHCALKPRCCPKGPFRRIPRDVNEHGRNHARALAGTQAFEDSSRRRKKIEMLFAHLKRQLGFDRLRLRGPTGARDEFLLAATVQNLRRLARLASPRQCSP